MIDKINTEKLKAQIEIMNKENLPLSGENLKNTADCFADLTNSFIDAANAISHFMDELVWEKYRKADCPYGMDDEDAYRWFNEQLEKEGD